MHDEALDLQTADALAGQRFGAQCMFLLQAIGVAQRGCFEDPRLRAAWGTWQHQASGWPLRERTCVTELKLNGGRGTSRRTPLMSTAALRPELRRMSAVRTWPMPWHSTSTGCSDRVFHFRSRVLRPIWLVIRSRSQCTRSRCLSRRKLVGSGCAARTTWQGDAGRRELRGSRERWIGTLSPTSCRLPGTGRIARRARPSSSQALRCPSSSSSSAQSSVAVEAEARRRPRVRYR